MLPADRAIVQCYYASQTKCPAALTAVSCPSISLCVAVDNGGNVITSTNLRGGSNTWKLTHIDNESTGCFHACPTALLAVSCPSTALCVASDTGGRIFWSTDPTGGAGAWGAATVASFPGETAVNGVSCASERLCVAVDIRGEIISTTNPAGGATAWNRATVDYFTDVLGNRNPGILNSVSCASESFCAAAEGIFDGALGGHLVISKDPAGGASMWTQVYADRGRLATCDPGGCKTSFHAISCSSSSLCVGVDDGGNTVTSMNPAEPATMWMVAHIDHQTPSSLAQGLTGVSCASNHFCAAVDVAGHILTSRRPTSGAASWRTINVIDAQLRLLLRQWLAPTGPAPRISSLLRTRRYALTVDPVADGRLQIDWYTMPKAANITKPTHSAKRVLLATGKAALSSNTRNKITIKLTNSGIRVLAGTKREKLTAIGTYTPTGRPPVTAATTITLTH
jgi:hypothetical protein